MMLGSWRKDIEHKLDLIYTALVVRDPGTSMAVEAYEGLRKQVIAGASGKQAQIAQLAEFDVALRRGARIEDLLSLTAQWLNQAGVAVIDRIDDPAMRHAFESTVAQGVPVDVEIPAYVNTATGQLVRQGRLREREVPAVEQRAVVEEAAPSEVVDAATETPDVVEEVVVIDGEASVAGGAVEAADEAAPTATVVERGKTPEAEETN